MPHCQPQLCSQISFLPGPHGSWGPRCFWEVAEFGGRGWECPAGLGSRLGREAVLTFWYLPLIGSGP